MMDRMDWMQAGSQKTGTEDAPSIIANFQIVFVVKSGFECPVLSCTVLNSRFTGVAAALTGSAGLLCAADTGLVSIDARAMVIHRYVVCCMLLLYIYVLLCVLQTPRHMY